jgi:hypothetical protein
VHPALRVSGRVLRPLIARGGRGPIGFARQRLGRGAIRCLTHRRWCLVNGLPGGTRTPDLLLRRQLLYPVELRVAGLACATGAMALWSLKRQADTKKAHWVSGPFRFFEDWSERRDSNSRPSAPKADALPGCATLRLSSELYLLKSTVLGRSKYSSNFFSGAAQKGWSAPCHRSTAFARQPKQLRPVAPRVGPRGDRTRP